MSPTRIAYVRTGLSVAAAWATVSVILLAVTTAADDRDSPPRTGSVNVRVLGLNDLHGNLEPTSTLNGRPVGGVGALAGYMDLYEAENSGPTFRVHSGDMVGGSPLASSRLHDEPTVQAMNLMGLDAGAPGNHAFDDGPEEMKRLIEGGEREGGVRGFSGAKFPYLAANVVESESGEPAFPPYQVLREDGVEVGFIGVMTPETTEITSPESGRRYRFLDISETVNRYAAELREQGVRTVVVLAHSGGVQRGERYSGEIFGETAGVEEVDLILAGHTHQRHEARVEGTPVLQADPLGESLSFADLTVDRATGEVTSISTRSVTAYADGPTDPELAGHAEEYASRAAPLAEREVGVAAEPVTRASTASGESALGDFVADAHRETAGADFGFVVSGALRDDLPEGVVTYGGLHDVQSFGEEVVKMKLNGGQLVEALEGQFHGGKRRPLQVSGLSYSYDASAPEGERVTGVALPSGAPLDPAADYTVAVDGPLAEGRGGFGVFAEGVNRESAGGITDSLARHAGSMPRPFSAPDPTSEGRISGG
ncbi:5'-nucleotidase C-terminal domain-containing protein [soil metagenome]